MAVQPQGYGQGYGPPGYGQTVVVQQPAARGPPRDWNHQLLGCCEDPCDCLMAWCFPLCYQCGLVQSANESVCIICCVPGWSIAMRTKIRERGNIEGSICNDCLMLYFCAPCAMCQMKREWDDIRRG